LTVAKLKLSDFLQDHRRLAVNKGQSVNGENTLGKAARALGRKVKIVLEPA
jgi:hypothetical protein